MCEIPLDSRFQTADARESIKSIPMSSASNLSFSTYRKVANEKMDCRTAVYSRNHQTNCEDTKPKRMLFIFCISTPGISKCCWLTSVLLVVEARRSQNVILTRWHHPSPPGHYCFCLSSHLKLERLQLTLLIDFLIFEECKEEPRKGVIHQNELWFFLPDFQKLRIVGFASWPRSFGDTKNPQLPEDQWLPIADHEDVSPGNGFLGDFFNEMHPFIFEHFLVFTCKVW